MKLGIYLVWDKVAEEPSSLMLFKTVGHALKTCQNSLENHPDRDDYVLKHVGTLQTDTGRITGQEPRTIPWRKFRPIESDSRGELDFIGDDV